MMKFPSELPRSRRSKTLRLAIAATALALFLTSIFGLSYALKPDRGQITTAGYETATQTLASAHETTASALGEKYGNGKIPRSELIEVAPGRYLVPDAAAGFAGLAAGLLASGHQVQVNSAYRTLAEQEGLVKRFGLLQEGGTAAPVGTSEHGLGISIDLSLNAAELGWMESRARDYGFSNTVAGEPWHWTYTGTA